MAERNPPLRANSTLANRHGEVLGGQDLRWEDFETRVRLAPRVSGCPPRFNALLGIPSSAAILVHGLAPTS